MADQDDLTNQDESKEEDSLEKKIKDLKKKDKKKTHEKYQKQIGELEQAKKEAEEKALRALAELKNAQKRMEEEKAAFAAFANQALVLQVLEIYENYHRLLEHEPEGLNEEWKKGFELIDQQFQSFFEQQGLKKIEVKEGDMVNPEQHQVMMSGEGEEGKILEVFSPGYEMRGRVIRAAKVKVGKAR